MQRHDNEKAATEKRTDVIRYYLDFDGTLTKCEGSTVVFSAAYAALQDQSSHSSAVVNSREAYGLRPFKHQLVELLQANPIFQGDFGFAPGALMFVSNALSGQAEVVIVTRNRGEYVRGMFLAAGLDPVLLAKIVIYDVNYDADVNNKYHIVLNHEKAHERVDHIIICDDTEGCARVMEAGVCSLPENRGKTIVFSDAPGCFDWDRVALSVKNIVFTSFSKEQRTEWESSFQPEALHGKWLIRESSTTENVFTIDCYTVDNAINFTSQRFGKDALLNLLRTTTYLSRLIYPSDELVSNNYYMNTTGAMKVTRAPVDTSSVVKQGFLAPGYDVNKMIAKMQLDQAPAVIIYRSSITKKVWCDRSQYAVTYVRETGELASFSFATGEKTIYGIKNQVMTLLMQQSLKPKQSVFDALSVVEPRVTKSCGLIHLHRNKKIRPEEMLFIVEPLAHSASVLILSTQTPTEKAKKGVASVANGGTGCEIERILSKAKTFPEKWIIVTGHGDQGAQALSGIYMSDLYQPGIAAEELDIICDAKEYAQLFLDSGLKSGDAVNILLYVCYSGAHKGDEKNSFATQLAECLAQQGIASYIVASKTAVARFDGQYRDVLHEVRGECLSYRVDGGPENIVVVTGKPGHPMVIEEKYHQYPDGFYITSDGLGARHAVVAAPIDTAQQLTSSISSMSSQ